MPPNPFSGIVDDTMSSTSSTTQRETMPQSSALAIQLGRPSSRASAPPHVGSAPLHVGSSTSAKTVVLTKTAPPHPRSLSFLSLEGANISVATSVATGEDDHSHASLDYSINTFASTFTPRDGAINAATVVSSENDDAIHKMNNNPESSIISTDTETLFAQWRREQQRLLQRSNGIIPHSIIGRGGGTLDEERHRPSNNIIFANTNDRESSNKVTTVGGRAFHSTNSVFTRLTTTITDNTTSNRLRGGGGGLFDADESPIKVTASTDDDDDNKLDSLVATNNTVGGGSAFTQLAGLTPLTIECGGGGVAGDGRSNNSTSRGSTLITPVSSSSSSSSSSSTSNSFSFHNGGDNAPSSSSGTRPTNPHSLNFPLRGDTPSIVGDEKKEGGNNITHDESEAVLCNNDNTSFSKCAGLLEEVRSREDELVSLRKELTALREDVQFVREEKRQGETEHAALQAKAKALSDLIDSEKRELARVEESS